MNKPEPSQTRVVSEGEEVSHDSRFGTRDTQLAAALLVLGFILAKQPFTTLADLTGGHAVKETTIWFRPVHEGMLAGQIERTFATANCEEKPELLWMRDAFQARRWFVKNVIHGNFPTPGTSPLKAWFQTDELALAAALKSCNVEFMGKHERRFYFAPIAEVAAKHARNQQASHRQRFAYVGLLQQAQLIHVIKSTTQQSSQVKAGGRKGTAFMHATMDENTRRAFLRELHES